MKQKNNQSYHQLLERAKRLCSKQEKCNHDIQQKLKAWGATSEMTESIISELTNENFINEQRYADFFVREKSKLNGWGKKKITYHLYQKQIPEDYIQKALEQIDENQYKEKMEEIIKKKYNNLNHEEDSIKLKAKLLRFATSKGFEQDESLKIINTLINAE